MKEKTKPDTEKKSSAITASDMEIFVFPELLYSIVLANIMSPRIWEWRKDPWFKSILKKSPRRRILRLKQYIMNNYVFNLDLETWGLTRREKELDRFKKYLSPEEISRSNALFGYEGDKYYFDIDIRTHFGLYKYDSEVIPYWKTETVEAMDAFSNKQGYEKGAGECVSLSTLYAAAMFIVARIPLDKIYLMATPLHSQNYVDTGKGLLTNNRRIITRNMWYNGTPISMKARRALENEKVTLVANSGGHIHILYKEATIDPDSYNAFTGILRKFLTTDLDGKIFGNFLRSRKDIHNCLQLRWQINGKDRFIALEKVFEYESDTPYLMTDNTRSHLIDSIDAEEFHNSPIPERIILNDVEDFIDEKKLKLKDADSLIELKKRIGGDCINSSRFVNSLMDFCITKADLPDPKEKHFTRETPLEINPNMKRCEIINYLKEIRGRNSSAELALYAFRDLSLTEPEPFLKAAIERNPVSAIFFKNKSIEKAAGWIKRLKNTSIYDCKTRLAQPDEVWNFQSGDGLEKAILLANIIKNKNHHNISIKKNGNFVLLNYGNKTFKFKSSKELKIQNWKLS